MSAAVQSAANTIMGAVGETVPGAGILSFALGYTVKTLMGPDPCNSVELRFQAMEKYTRDELNKINGRFEQAWKEEADIDMVIMQGELRNRIKTLSLSLDYLKNAKNEQDFDNKLEPAIRDLSWVSTTYDSLATNVRSSKSLVYISGVSQSLSYQGLYLEYLSVLHSALIKNKKIKWKLPHADDATQQISLVAKNYGQFLQAIRSRADEAFIHKRFNPSTRDFRPKYFDASGKELDGSVPPIIVNGFGSVNRPHGPYMQARSDAVTASVVFPNNAYVDYEIIAFGGVYKSQKVAVSNREVKFINPLKDCMSKGQESCEDQSELLEYGMSNLKEYTDDKGIVYKLFDSVSKVQVLEAPHKKLLSLL
ncbi:MAG: hypothetical protein NTX25_13415 [Proteobacteria bacterium]|nr:hypothetical protein [Pseudomonadota bacterium]